jgi:3-oxoacyl-[acyl-carrier protein] reductase
MSMPIALITGAARGIGRAIGERLSADGFHVVLTDMDEAAGNATAKAIGDAAEFHACDVSDEQQVRALFQDLMQRHGRVDVLVNNAGITRDAVIWKMSSADFDQVIAVNLKGAWLMCREAATTMRAQNSGRIINIASRGWLGNFGQSNYGPSKGGLVSLTRVLALELGRHNVLVNAVAPGAIDTPMLQAMDEEARERLRQAQPTKSLGAPEDVAHAVAFLADPRTRSITGQTLYVDGGKSIGAGV